MKSVSRVLFSMVFISLLAACDPFWGGGWLWSPYDGMEKTNLSFHVKCDEGFYGVDDPDVADVRVTLKLNLHDRGYPKDQVFNQHKNNKKHMAISSVTDHELFYVVGDGTCMDHGFNLGLGAVGKYCPSGFKYDDDPAVCGGITLFVTDVNEDGPSMDDLIYVKLDGGAYDGYEIGQWDVEDPQNPYPVGLPLEGGEITYEFGEASGL